MIFTSPVRLTLASHYTHLKLVVVVIDDCSARTGGPDEANAWGVGSQLTGTLSRHSIRWIKDCSRGYGAEHGNVLQSHLAGAVLTNTYTSMGSNTVQVGLETNTNHVSILFVISKNDTTTNRLK